MNAKTMLQLAIMVAERLDFVYLEVIMDFKSFLIVFVVGMFVSFITSLIREKFLKSPKKNKDRSN